MRRTFGEEVVCPDCGGKLRLIALVKKEETIQAPLKAMHLPTEATGPPQRAKPEPATTEPLELESTSALVLGLLAGRNGLDFGLFDRLFLGYLAISGATSGLMWLVAQRITANLPAILLAGAAGGIFCCLVLYMAKDPMAREIAGLGGKDPSRVFGNF